MDREHALTVVVPTYDESANLPSLFRELASLMPHLDTPMRVLIVDDASPDGTAALAANLGRDFGVRTEVIVRSEPRSLGRAIVEGVAACRTDLVAVMDADLSHPPGVLALMVERLNGFDGVVASRYAAGGRILGWPLHRRVISFVARMMADRVVRTPSSDPLSGFFLFRRSSLQGVSLTGLGNKPLVEILARSDLTLYEVPYIFRNRENGRSKLRARAVLQYLGLTLSLGWDRIRDGREAPAPMGDAEVEQRDP